MRQQLEDLGGPGMTILVDSFEGGQLPNKSQIRSIRISRDQFAAESHSAGGIRIEIVTQPGQGDIRGNVRTNFYTSAWDGTNPLVDVAPPSRNVNGGVSLSGGLIRDRMSFSLNLNGTNNFTTPIQSASGSAGTETRVIGVRNTTINRSITGGIDWAVTKNQTARIQGGLYDSYSRNVGLGAYDSPERGYRTDNPEWYVQGSHTGPIGRRMMLYNRFYVDVLSTRYGSNLDELTIVVPDDLNRGGAQRRGRSDTTVFYSQLGSRLRRRPHSFRTGIELQTYDYFSDAETNNVGTYYFESPEAFAAGTPRSFTRRMATRTSPSPTGRWPSTFRTTCV